ncbi:MAG: HWE histidine kinase domain-containing protein [Tsuneonella suprasediminis]|nr:hypothetical protein LBX01_15915 [Altererythrobacter sp. N1]
MTQRDVAHAGGTGSTASGIMNNGDMLSGAQAAERHAREMARELSHRTKNMFSVISGIVNITGRARGAESVAGEINGRIQALGRAYETTLDEASSGSIELGQAIRAILDPYVAEGRTIRFKGNGLQVPFQTVSTVGLVLFELADNANRHGAWSTPDGFVDLDWYWRDDALEITWRERGGSVAAGAAASSGTGYAIMDRLLRTAGGSITRDWCADGLDVTLHMPTIPGAGV